MLARWRGQLSRHTVPKSKLLSLRDRRPAHHPPRPPRSHHIVPQDCVSHPHRARQRSHRGICPLRIPLWRRQPRPQSHSAFLHRSLRDCCHCDASRILQRHRKRHRSLCRRHLAPNPAHLAPLGLCRAQLEHLPQLAGKLFSHPRTQRHRLRTHRALLPLVPSHRIRIQDGRLHAQFLQLNRSRPLPLRNVLWRRRIVGFTRQAGHRRPPRHPLRRHGRRRISPRPARALRHHQYCSRRQCRRADRAHRGPKQRARRAHRARRGTAAVLCSCGCSSRRCSTHSAREAGRQQVEQEAGGQAQEAGQPARRQRPRGKHPSWRQPQRQRRVKARCLFLF
eukprot:comp20652_c0_seq1/m.42181 comp20652_c0_seq1/g.42181  ORF comp20652_c0_seq1/g.42181 comp20652_c0_seq1/m.42181 type:complete len:336 (-) comp20652_c0_seq1:396-1403(-)